MPRCSPREWPGILEEIRRGRRWPVYLFVGERYLCREAAEELLEALLPDPELRERAVALVDGEREEPLATLAAVKTFSLFGAPRVVKVVDWRLLLSRSTGQNLWDRARQAHEQGDLPRAAKLLAQVFALAEMTLDDWRGQSLAGLDPASWQRFFGFSKPQQLDWVDEVAESGTSQAAALPRDEIQETYGQAIESGFPEGNCLVLLAETVDKRKKLFKCIASHGVVVELLAAEKAGGLPGKEQGELLKELVAETLSRFKKTIASDALPVLLERVGFNPVAVVLETEKLALSKGEEERITKADLDRLVGRTREEAVFELSEAFNQGDLALCLELAQRMAATGYHPLALVAGMRNHLRKLLLMSAAAGRLSPPVPEALAYPAFQKKVLPALKEAVSPWPPMLDGHPYGLYKLFLAARRFGSARLREFLGLILEAEYRLKGSAVDPRLALEHFFFAALGGEAAEAFPRPG